MKIEQFKIKVLSEEQNRIVQQILFKNGYTWASGETNDSINIYINYSHLVFKKCDYYNKNCLYWSIDFSECPQIPLITFEKFINKYTIKGERKEKLKKLSNEN